MELFEWDARKAETNVRIHGISFETAKRVFFDPFVFSRKDHTTLDEERLQSIGLVGSRQIILVVHMVKDDQQDTIIRIISARKAERSERDLYHTSAIQSR